MKEEGIIMNEEYQVVLYFENGDRAPITLIADSKLNLEGWIQKTDWLKCGTSGMVYNMKKVLSFEIFE